MSIGFSKSKNCERAEFDADFGKYYGIIRSSIGFIEGGYGIEWHHTGGNTNNISYFCKTKEEYEKLKENLAKQKEEKRKEKKERKFKSKASALRFLNDQNRVEEKEGNFVMKDGKYGLFYDEDDIYNCTKIYFKLNQTDIDELLKVL